MAQTKASPAKGGELRESNCNTYDRDGNFYAFRFLAKLLFMVNYCDDQIDQLNSSIPKEELVERDKADMG